MGLPGSRAGPGLTDVESGLDLGSWPQDCWGTAGDLWRQRSHPAERTQRASSPLTPRTAKDKAENGQCQEGLHQAQADKACPPEWLMGVTASGQLFLGVLGQAPQEHPSHSFTWLSSPPLLCVGRCGSGEAGAGLWCPGSPPRAEESPISTPLFLLSAPAPLRARCW